MDKHIAIRRWTKRIGVGDGRGTEITAIADLHDLGQGPYFSLTSEETDKWTRRHNKIRAGGCDHEEIAKRFPHLAKYISYHLWHLDRGPWYYLENTRYFIQKGNLDAAKRNILYGALPTDEDVDLADYSWEALEAWLIWRRPQVIALFHTAMRELFPDLALEEVQA